MEQNAIEDAISTKTWDLGNQVLYDLCKTHPTHSRDDVIIAKVWLIGRAYAAAVERRTKHTEAKGEFFYETRVAPIMRKSGIDLWLAEAARDPSEATALRAHARLTDLFKRITGMRKRSLASKYLHFHCPDSFFIYDSRAQTTIAKLVPDRSLAKNRPSECDPVYADFYRKCAVLRSHLTDQLRRSVSPRDLDKVLLARPSV